MNAGMSFIAIVSLLLALGVAGSQQEHLTSRKAGGKQQEYVVGAASPQRASQSARSKLATNHNETLVRDTTTLK